MWVWSPVDFTLDIFRCTIAGCGGPRISVDESGASDPHNILCGKRQGCDTQWIQHAGLQITLTNWPTQLTEQPFIEPWTWSSKAIQRTLKSRNTVMVISCRRQRPVSRPWFERGQHASGVRIMWEWDTTFFLVHGQNTIENEENPENPGGVLAAEKAGCLMQTSKREAVNSSMMATGPWGWEDYTAVPGSLTQLEGALSCLEHLYRSLQTPEKCQGSNVFDCKKPCSRWNLDLGFCLLPRAAKMSWSWKFDIYIYIQWGGSKSRKVWKREMNNSMYIGSLSWPWLFTCTGLCCKYKCYSIMQYPVNPCHVQIVNMYIYIYAHMGLEVFATVNDEETPGSFWAT